jgi:hypothetical protein
MSNLALDLRPQKLEDVIGQDSTKRAIKSFAEKDQWPNVFLFYGPSGTGKTTLALIVAKLAGAEGDGLREINASGDNGVDFARQLAEDSASVPFCGRRKVIILNEFHQFTLPAQQVLKDPMEKNSTLWILTTDRVDKIDAAIRSRASAATFELKPLNDSQLCQLLTKVDPQLLKDSVGTFLWKHGVTAPREVLGVLDLYLAGTPIEEAIHGSEHEPLYTELSSAVLSGNWTKSSEILKQIKTGDYRAMVAVVSAKLSWALLDSDFGPRADALATCVVGLGTQQFADGVAYASLKGLLYKACSKLGTKT